MSDKSEPAFPAPGETWRTGDVAHTELGSPGMSLRDWFAGQALIGFTQVSGVAGVNRITVAEMAYGMADAMLKVREWPT